MKHNNLKGSLILCTAAFIWGIAFVAQSTAADKVPPFTMNALRSFIGAAALLIFWAVTAGRRDKHFFPKNKKDKKQYIIAAFACGTALYVSVNFQQFGLTLYPDGVASEARAGFLTALYVVLVPIMSVFMHKKINPVIWLSIAAALAGIYLLCLTGGISHIYLGDLLLLLCAFSFTVQIIAVDKYVGFTGGVKLSIMQFFVCGALSGISALIFETSSVSVSGIAGALPQILYLGIMSSGVAYTLQIVGQKYAEPAVASLSMSLESVFAALGGWLIAGNALSPREIGGCALVFVAIILAQVPEMRNKTQQLQ